MEKGRQHIVNQLRLDLEVENQEQSFHVRHQLSSYWQEWILPEIERACNLLGDGPQQIWIDHLEIDLGKLFIGDFEAQFREKLTRKLDEQMQKQAFRPDSNHDGLNPGISDITLLRYFLQTGQYPWWAAHDAEDINLVFERIFKNNPRELRHYLAELSSSRLSLRRLLLQVDQQLLTNALVSLFLSDIHLEETKKTVRELEKQFSHEQWTENQRTSLLLIMLMEKASHSGIVLAEMTTVQLPKMLRKYEEILGLEVIEKMKLADENVFENSPEKDWPENALEQKNNEEAYQKLLTPFAGLILLAPFLPQFFTNTGLLANNAFQNREARYQAVHLLHYIATGETGAAEHELTFGKLLCGISLQEPVPRDTVLTDADLAEADDLIRSVQAHWKPLSNTSVEGFRTTFLIRNGILYDEGSQWKLRVERKAFDVLLGKISWGFAFINFSWISKPIETEW
ncbi:contractile injection system tape measure protein [Dyadobacter arcticus]|uniref:TIGR02678 family protein n=1 Tax=Dyadobacter arcticus TaxID=1078754 RepID=A0ABX0UUU3_9BACT|nr:contractile injection system tape measure protein [Dyadobacter arcticus]NIJ54696.1 hypothetical protein [Dyadobacter arcticus]